MNQWMLGESACVLCAWVRWVWSAAVEWEGGGKGMGKLPGRGDRVQWEGEGDRVQREDERVEWEWSV